MCEEATIAVIRKTSVLSMFFPYIFPISDNYILMLRRQHAVSGGKEILNTFNITVLHVDGENSCQ